MSIRIAAALIVVAVAAASCGSDGRDDALVVFAASSLTDALTEIEAAFRTAHPGIDVTMSFAGSSSLREQILGDAPADVFASASPSDMEKVVAAAVEPVVPVGFASSELVIAVPGGNPGGVAGLEDLADPGLLIGLCAVEVPCGEYAAASLAGAGITPAIDTAEPNVRALLSKIEAGELDAGVVYTTDVEGNDRVEAVPIPPRFNVRATYPIAALTDGAAEDFVDFVQSPPGQAILARHGFLAP